MVAEGQTPAVEPSGKQDPARPLCVCRLPTLKGPLKGAGAAHIQMPPPWEPC